MALILTMEQFDVAITSRYAHAKPAPELLGLVTESMRGRTVDAWSKNHRRVRERFRLKKACVVRADGVGCHRVPQLRVDSRHRE
ncbi:MAG: hypothetical protein ABL962_15120 [Fimbriimonadaceae bacterium]